MACSEVVWLQDAKHIKDNEIYNSNQDQSTENLRSLIQPNSVSTSKSLRIRDHVDVGVDVGRDICSANSSQPIPSSFSVGFMWVECPSIIKSINSHGKLVLHHTSSFIAKSTKERLYVGIHRHRLVEPGSFPRVRSVSSLESGLR